MKPAAGDTRPGDTTGLAGALGARSPRTAPRCSAAAAAGCRELAAGSRRTASAGRRALSFSQQRMWFLDQWEPGAPTFNGARAVQDSRPARPRRSQDGVRDRRRTAREPADGLRACTTESPGRSCSRTGRSSCPWSSWARCRARERTSELARRLRELAREPFDLSKDLMIRTTVFSLGEDDCGAARPAAPHRCRCVLGRGALRRGLDGLREPQRLGDVAELARAPDPVSGLRRLADRPAPGQGARRPRRLLDERAARSAAAAAASDRPAAPAGSAPRGRPARGASSRRSSPTACASLARAEGLHRLHGPARRVLDACSTG